MYYWCLVLCYAAEGQVKVGQPRFINRALCVATGTFLVSFSLALLYYCCDSLLLGDYTNYRKYTEVSNDIKAALLMSTLPVSAHLQRLNVANGDRFEPSKRRKCPKRKAYSTPADAPMAMAAQRS